MDHENREEEREKCNQNSKKIIIKYIVRILIIKITESTLNSKEELNSDYDSNLRIDD